MTAARRTWSWSTTRTFRPTRSGVSRAWEWCGTRSRSCPRRRRVRVRVREYESTRVTAGWRFAPRLVFTTLTLSHSLRPFAIHHRLEFQLRRIDYGVFDARAFPGVNDVDQAIRGLNRRRIREFAGFVFKRQRGQPLFSVRADGHVQRAAARFCVIVNQQVAAIFERDGIDA